MPCSEQKWKELQAILHEYSLKEIGYLKIYLVPEYREKGVFQVGLTDWQAEAEDAIEVACWGRRIKNDSI